MPLTDKEILTQYVHAHELLIELDEDIQELSTKVLKDKVKGSNPEYPYEERSFSLSGKDCDAWERKITQKIKQKEAIQEVDDRAQEIINSAPASIQRIIRFRCEKGLSWEEVARRMGGRISGEGRRQELYRYIKNLKKLS